MPNKSIFRARASAVCLKDDRLLMVNILDKIIGKHYWMPPGGEIESDESPYLAAEREALEETGVIVKAYPEAKTIKQYSFDFNDQQYVTKTYFFLAEYLGVDESFSFVRREKEVFSSEWVPLKVAFERMFAWQEVQSAVYELIFPLLRRRACDLKIDVAVPLKKSVQED